jgi:hypothetical protein
VNLRLLGIPILNINKITSQDVNGIKIMLINALNFTFTFGSKSGEHLHFALGILRWEIFWGFSIWEKNGK